MNTEPTRCVLLHCRVAKVNSVTWSDYWLQFLLFWSKSHHAVPRKEKKTGCSPPEWTVRPLPAALWTASSGEHLSQRVWDLRRGEAEMWALNSNLLLWEQNKYLQPCVFYSVVLKTVENLGVSYVKATEHYNKKMYNEIHNLNFPYKPEVVSLPVSRYTINMEFYPLRTSMAAGFHSKISRNSVEQHFWFQVDSGELLIGMKTFTALN